MTDVNDWNAEAAEIDALTAGALPLDEPGLTLEIVPLGRLSLPTGRITAADPLYMEDTAPFDRAVPPGTYPVEAALVRFASTGEVRVAAVKLRLGEGAPARWELALKPGEACSALAPGEVYGYGVDSGFGGLMDEQAARALQARLDDAAYGDELYALANAAFTPEWSSAWVDLDGEGLSPTINALIISAGFGDGFFPSFWGLDAHGNPVVLMTDFGLV